MQPGILRNVAQRLPLSYAKQLQLQLYLNTVLFHSILIYIIYTKQPEKSDLPIGRVLTTINI